MLVTLRFTCNASNTIHHIVRCFEGGYRGGVEEMTKDKGCVEGGVEEMAKGEGRVEERRKDKGWGSRRNDEGKKG